MSKKHLAILDLGTNTFHFLEVIINNDRSFFIKDKFKIAVELGFYKDAAGYITEQGIQRALEAMEIFQDVIHARNIPNVIACATSAIREAKNQKAILQTIYQRTGIQVKVLTAEEEAFLIYLGIKNGVQFSKTALMVDIGGGSVEFIIGNQEKPFFLNSMPMGAANLLKKFPLPDPVNPDYAQQLMNYFNEQLAFLKDRMIIYQPSLWIGSSGAFESIGKMIAYRKKETSAANQIHHYQITYEDFLPLYQTLLCSTKEERLKMKGLEPIRVDMIVPSAILMAFLWQWFPKAPLIVSSYALKEGILFQYIEEHFPVLTQGETVQEEAVKALMQKYQVDEQHAWQVAKLSLLLFDALAPLHQLGATERQLLFYAALLHDIGYFIHRSGHHKHAQYIILNSHLRGFSQEALLLLSNLVRYHRKSLPDVHRHEYFRKLSKKDRQKLWLLFPLLRVADQLDRGHDNAVHHLTLTPIAKGVYQLNIYCKKEPYFQKDKLKDAIAVLEEVYGIRVRFRCIHQSVLFSEV